MLWECSQFLVYSIIEGATNTHHLLEQEQSYQMMKNKRTYERDEKQTNGYVNSSV